MVRKAYATAEEVQAMLLRSVDVQIKILQEAIETGVVQVEKTRDVIDCLLDVRSASSKLVVVKVRQKATA